MLYGDTVTLRAPAEGDLDALYALAADLTTWEERTATPPRPLSRAEYVARFTRPANDEDSEARFVVEVDGELVGRCDLFAIQTLARNAELGIALHPAARGLGYGTDALRVLVGFAFQRRNLHRVYLTAIASNAAAIACYRKVGFVEEGRQRESAWVRGEYQDEIFMGLLRSDWAGRNPAREVAD